MIANEALTSQFSGIGASNYSIINGTFRWLSYDEFPIDTRRTDYIDLNIRLPKGCRSLVNWGGIVFPLCIAALGVMIIFRRQRK